MSHSANDVLVDKPHVVSVHYDFSESRFAVSPVQAEGFLHVLFGMMRLDLSAPDYTTLSRRSQHLRRRLRPVPTDEGLHLVLDSTGLSIVGAGEWAAAKHGGRGRRGWRKLHLGVDQSGVIRVHTLTEETGDDATTALDLLTAVDGPLVRVTADAAYDTVAVYKTATARGATVVIPPARTANVSGHGPRSPARDRTIQLVKKLGRRRWKKASGYLSSEPGGERVLSIQIHHRRWPSRPEPSRTGLCASSCANGHHWQRSVCASGGEPRDVFLLLLQKLPIEVAVIFEPALVGLRTQGADEP